MGELISSKAADYEAILLCGGKGERLTEVTGDQPKSLLNVGGRELIRYTVDSLDSRLIEHLVFAIDYKGEQIMDWVGDTELPHVISFSRQSEPGILTAITDASEHIEGEGMVACNTDEIRDGFRLAEAIRFHQSRDTLATMVVARADHLHRHRLISVRPDGLISRTELKPEAYSDKPEVAGLVNTGLLLLDGGAFDYFDRQHDPGWSGIIDPLCDAGELSAFINEEIRYFNVGTMDEYVKARNYLRESGNS